MHCAVMGIRQGIVLSEQKALHVRALTTFDDRVVGVRRTAGEEWLLTHKECAVYIPPPEVNVVCEQQLHSLKRGEFCYLSNPRDSTTNELMKGRRVLLSGELNFYLVGGAHRVIARKEGFGRGCCVSCIHWMCVRDVRVCVRAPMDV
jgi:Major Vault Protein repeat domain